MRRIDLVRQHGYEGDPALDFESLRKDIEQKIAEISNELDDLIRHDNINVNMATSLMNDISYCENICVNLLTAGSILFCVPGEFETSEFVIV
jgi:hypothetical protein